MESNICSTLSAEEAASRIWDAVVIGAGVAGSAVAAELSRQGRQVILLDKQIFPRGKVCGGCLNASAVQTLERLDLLDAAEGAPIRRIILQQSRNSRAELPLRGGIAVSRARFDARLLAEALRRGTHFLGGWRAHTSILAGSERQVDLRGDGGERLAVRGRVVLACDGLGSLLAREAGLSVEHSNGCRVRPKIGMSATIPCNVVPELEQQTILMLCGRTGYVGLVHCGEGHVNLAAALVPEAVSGQPWVAVMEVIRECGLGAETEAPPEIQVCPRLHRRVARPWADRLILVGDAAGYVEPITGEGMAWALAGAEAAAAELCGGWTSATGLRYEKRWRQEIASRRARVQAAAYLLDSPRRTRAGIAAMNLMPKSILKTIAG